MEGEGEMVNYLWIGMVLCALVAGAGCGLWDSLPQALEILRVQDVTDPSADAERYEAPYQTYTKLYQALQTIQAK